MRLNKRRTVPAVVLATTIIAILGVSSPAVAATCEPYLQDSYYGESGTEFADVTGDGKADEIMLFLGGILVRPSTGAAYGCASNWTYPTGFIGNVGTYFADVTGDGKADAIAVNSSGGGAGVTVRRSTGSSFSANETWISGAYFGDRETTFADATGDGKADAIVVNNSGVTVRRSTGSSFSANETWVPTGYYGTAGTYFADVNGDGRADAIVVNAPSGTAVKLSNGNSFGATSWWTSGAFVGNIGTYFADVTGDGKADAVVNNSSGGGAGVTVRPSTGSSFSANQTWISGGYYGNVDPGMYLTDATGDQKADAIVLNTIGGGAGVTVRRSYGNSFGWNETWLLP